MMSEEAFENYESDYQTLPRVRDKEDWAGSSVVDGRSCGPSNRPRESS